MQEKSIFNKMGFFIYKKIVSRRFLKLEGKQVQSDLAQLFPGENSEWKKTEYYTNKIALFLMIVTVGAIFGILVTAKSLMESKLGEDNTLVRTDLGEEDSLVEVLAEYDEETYSFQIALGAREPKEDEAREWIAALMNDLPSLMLGENESAEEVTGNLLLQEKYEGYPVTVTWESEDSDIVNPSGEVYAGETAQEVTLIATLTCGEVEMQERFLLTIQPENLSERERAYREIDAYLKEEEEAGRKSESFTLPSVWNGKQIVWSKKQKMTGLILWFGSLVTAVLVYFFSDKDLHTKLEKRKKKLLEEYPDLVQELVLLVGAGMTMRGAFQKVSTDYEKRDKKGRDSPAREEIVRTCRQMQAGMAEGAAYEQFGRRIGVQQYIRLSGLFSQNLKRGNAALPERMREEAYRASEEKLSNVRKLGEEAGTKLLIPMVMLLAVVMLLIMVPAFEVM